MIVNGYWYDHYDDPSAAAIDDLDPATAVAEVRRRATLILQERRHPNPSQGADVAAAHYSRTRWLEDQSDEAPDRGSTCCWQGCRACDGPTVELKRSGSTRFHTAQCRQCGLRARHG